MATACNDATGHPWRPLKRLWAIFGLAVLISISLTAIAGWREEHAFVINTSDSLPNWAFVVHRNRAPEKGEYVFFEPPGNALVRRHFGTAPSMFGKIVYGMPGDHVAHLGQDVVVNGTWVGRMKPLTRFGQPLMPGITGAIPHGCYYVGTPHKDGFDSRYKDIGFVCRSQIVGTGEPVL
jgi:conjugal transfer pilin signal peptidase TrbI